MIEDLKKSIYQMFSFNFIVIFAISFIITVIIFFIAALYLNSVISDLDISSMPVLLQETWYLLSGLISLIVTLSTLWLFYPIVSTLVMSLFFDFIVDSVEARYYPHNRASQPMGFWRGLRLGAISAARMLGINLLLTPVYLILLFSVIGPFIFALIVNSILMARDYWQIVAIRHLGAQEASLRAENKAEIVKLGLMLSGLFFLPGFNLVAPLIGVAMATHGVHRQRAARLL
jgi:CysZ protein